MQWENITTESKFGKDMEQLLNDRDEEKYGLNGDATYQFSDFILCYSLKLNNNYSLVYSEGYLPADCFSQELHVVKEKDGQLELLSSFGSSEEHVESYLQLLANYVLKSEVDLNKVIAECGELKTIIDTKFQSPNSLNLLYLAEILRERGSENEYLRQYHPQIAFNNNISSIIDEFKSKYIGINPEVWSDLAKEIKDIYKNTTPAFFDKKKAYKTYLNRRHYD
jgi:hypothetical protein